MVILLPEQVKYIMDTITAAGYEAYAVGGCIRDSLMGRVPDDWDITTSAKPSQVKALFRRTIDTGIQHGTVTVMLDKQGFEVTTYRIDGKYEDSRHPAKVSFTPDLLEDLRRRDFTINAMAYNERTGLVDAFGGLQDMENRIVRCVGDARERFAEDALRIMRAIRFSAQLGYEIDEDTSNAIRRMASNLANISAERIQAELVKLVISGHPEYLRVAYETGITAIILPELDVAMQTQQKHLHHCYSVGEHILHSMMEIPGEKVLRLAMLFHDIGKPCTLTTDEKGITHFHGHESVSSDMAQVILRRLKFDNNTIHIVQKLVFNHGFGFGEGKDQESDRKVVRRAIHRIGEDVFPGLFFVKRADFLAQSNYQRGEKLARIQYWQRVYEDVVGEQECVSLKTLAISGKDLIGMGMQPGKEIGDTLDRLLDMVLDQPECNHKEFLLKQVF